MSTRGIVRQMNLTCWWKWRSNQKRPADRAPFRATVCSEKQNAFHTFGIQIKNILLILFILSFLGFHLNGCTTKYGTREPDQKQALRTLAGGVAGVLLAGNIGGAIVGALVVDVVSVATIKYEDKQLENGDQAAKRYKDQDKKAEDGKDQDKKAEDRKDQDKKAEDKKNQEQKAEDRKDQDKKAEDRKNQEQKAEKKKWEEKRVSLFIEESSVATHTVRTGSTVKANIQYTLLAPEGTENVKITETRKLWTAYSTRELDTRDITRTQGTYLSSIQFTMPEDMPKGYCILYTTVSDGKRPKTASSVMNIL
jgi:flagellar biosynthesis GTPase FlhF